MPIARSVDGAATIRVTTTAATLAAGTDDHLPHEERPVATGGVQQQGCSVRYVPTVRTQTHTLFAVQVATGQPSIAFATAFIFSMPDSFSKVPFGRTDGRTHAWSDERTDGRTDTRTSGRIVGRTDGQADGRADGAASDRWTAADGRLVGRSVGLASGRTVCRSDQWMDERTDGQWVGRTV